MGWRLFDKDISLCCEWLDLGDSEQRVRHDTACVWNLVCVNGVLSAIAVSV